MRYSGIDSTFGGLEALITGLCDEYPRLLGRHREWFVAALLVFIYVCALPTVTSVRPTSLTLSHVNFSFPETFYHTNNLHHQQYSQIINNCLHPSYISIDYTCEERKKLPN
jgi:hypothetical protein